MFCLKLFSRWSTSSKPCPPSPTIMNMPYLVMREILKHSDFLTILILRRVCQDFRHFIDHYMPPWIFEEITVVTSHWETQIVLRKPNTRNMKGRRSITYSVREHGVSISQWVEWTCFDPITLENENFVDAFIQDFSWILRNQERKLKSFIIEESYFIKNWSYEVPRYYTFFGCIKREIMCGDMRKYKPFWKRKPNTRRIIDSFARALKSRATPFQTDRLEVSVFDQEQLMKILKNVDLESIEYMLVRRVYEGNSGASKFLEMEELEKLKRWKDVEEVHPVLPGDYYVFFY